MDIDSFRYTVLNGPKYNSDVYNSISPYIKAKVIGTIFDAILNDQSMHELVNRSPKDSMYRLALRFNDEYNLMENAS